ncbi:unnamed protein product [Kluyveromyces dobzhanskii CBS 2104]|uniref:WGS project CCBQ000000000 data, contig 00015 n=1 Tax=Kluyveromyces dobzhanskii CBS 2104 TaxID=1427455 RepID=A0A0A8LBQ0_9SACH|nr:unnamed protein product [Kluyveromyces dobzhanskii CBS 2104]
MELQNKRRRVTRACDECRKKKVKCDGKQPCIHCTVYNYDCTYNQPTRRAVTSTNSSNSVVSSGAGISSGSGKKPSVSSLPSDAFGISGSENRVGSESGNLPHAKRFGIGLTGASGSPTSGNVSAVPHGHHKKYSSSKNKVLQIRVSRYEELLRELIPDVPDIDSIDIPTFAQLFHNTTKDINLNEMVQEYTLIAPTEVAPIVTRDRDASDAMSTGGTSATSQHTQQSSQQIENVDGSIQSHEGKEIKIILPPKPIAIQFIKSTWENCCVLFRFYHRPSFIRQLDLLYETDPQNYTHEQMQFLPLCYAVMAVGALFTKTVNRLNVNLQSPNASTNTNINNNNTENNTNTYDTDTNISNANNNTNNNNNDNDNNNNNNNSNNNVNNANANNNNNNNSSNDASTKFLQDEGYKYFIAARKLIDITNARDLNSIQTIVLLFLFLQCSARLSTSYSYIGVAMRSALREGLHRKLEPDPSKKKTNFIEIEMRKRLFYTIYKMDIYINTMLGLPRTISSRDFDQELPLELNDDYITEDAVYPDEQGDVLSSAGIANQHTKILMILDQIMADLYPIKKTNNLISHQMVTNLELKLRQWLDQLPPELIPGLKDVPEKYLRANCLLHLSFLQVQIILYRPFIHYLSPSAPQTDALSIQRAKNCISVARTVVKLAKEMMDAKILPGSYWFSIYTIFFSVAALIYYVRELTPTNSHDIAMYDEIMKDVKTGKQLLLQLKETSVAASRTYNLLSALFNSFNAKTKQSVEMQRKLQREYQATEMKLEDTSDYSGSFFDLPLDPSSDNAVISPDRSIDGVERQMPTPSFLNNTFPVEPNTSISGVNTLNTSQTANLFSSTNFGTSLDPIDSNMDKYLPVDISQPRQPLQQTPQFISTTPNQIPDSAVDGTYVPGMFDQLDVQLFGRYLPPYMSGVSANDPKGKEELDDS